MARRAVREWLDAEGCSHVLPVAELITTELVTNAVVHGGDPIRLSLRSEDDGVVCVEVYDSNATLARRGEAHANGAGGRGLQIVEALSLEWGSDRLDDGKVTWARVATNADDDEWDQRPRASVV